MSFRPDPGTIVQFGRRRYDVVRHGCATGMKNCPHGENAVTVHEIGKPESYTLCLAAAALRPVEEVKA